MFISIISLLVLGFLFYKLYPYINPPANCFDKKQNGDERGVDCGGSCDLICRADIFPLEDRFTRFVESENSLYDFVAMVNNKNADKVPEGDILNYNFTVYDKAGSVVRVVEGTTDVPVGQIFPVIRQNIQLDFGSSGNSISRVVFNILNNDGNWQRASEIYKNNFFEVLGHNFEIYKNNVTQLTIQLQNLTRAYFRDVPIRILLLDNSGNIFAMNETLVKEIDPRQKFEINFTWRVPLGIPNPQLEVYPIVTPNTYLK